MKKKNTVKFLGAMALATALLTGPMISDTMQFGKEEVKTAQAAKIINGSKLVVPTEAITKFKDAKENNPQILKYTFYEATEEQMKYRYVVNKDTYGYEDIRDSSAYKQKFSAKDQRKMQLQSFSVDDDGTVYVQMRFVDGFVGKDGGLGKAGTNFVSLDFKASDLKIQM